MAVFQDMESVSPILSPVSNLVKLELLTVPASFRVEVFVREPIVGRAPGFRFAPQAFSPKFLTERGVAPLPLGGRFLLRKC